MPIQVDASYSPRGDGQRPPCLERPPARCARAASAAIPRSAWPGIRSDESGPRVPSGTSRPADRRCPCRADRRRATTAVHAQWHHVPARVGALDDSSTATSRRCPASTPAGRPTRPSGRVRACSATCTASGPRMAAPTIWRRTRSSTVTARNACSADIMLGFFFPGAALDGLEQTGGRHRQTPSAPARRTPPERSVSPSAWLGARRPAAPASPCA